MPAFSYELGDLRRAMKQTANDDRPFQELFVKIEARYGTSRQIENASITGMDNVTFQQHGDGFTIVGEGMAALEDLDAGQDAFIVRAKVTTGTNFARTRTEYVIVTDEDGTTYRYGSLSSRRERANN